MLHFEWNMHPNVKWFEVLLKRCEFCTLLMATAKVGNGSGREMGPGRPTTGC